jgi:Zn-dependent peptidase ImmA (M78 family)
MKIAIFPGAFKPPHRGHFFVAKTLADRPDIDNVIIAVSDKDRKGITSDQSINIWELYKNKLGSKVEIVRIYGSPVTYVSDQIRSNPDNQYVAVYGKGEGSRFNSLIGKPNVEIFDSGNLENISGTDFRDAIRSRNIKLISSFLPKKIKIDQFFNAFNKKKEETSPTSPLLEHSIYENQLPLLKPFITYCKEYLKLKTLPPLTLSYKETDAENMKSFGGYNPNIKNIRINIANRHQADIFRTLAHELCHYKQDTQNRLEPNSGQTGHPHENEANSHAAIIMRNFAHSNPEMFKTQ